MNNVTISEEVRNAETLKNQLKYEKRATRLAETAVTSMASGLGGEGADGDNNSGMVDASEIVLGLESGLSGAKAELAGKGKVNAIGGYYTYTDPLRRHQLYSCFISCSLSCAFFILCISIL